MKEQQVGGEHYARMKIDPITFAWVNGYDFMAGNILKYVARHAQKGGAADLGKAKHFTVYRASLIENRGLVLPPAKNVITIHEFVVENQIDTLEADVLLCLHLWVQNDSAFETDDQTATVICARINHIIKERYNG